MKKILCPTDFSEAANNAIEFAARYAKHAHATLYLFNKQSVFSLEPGEILTREPPTVIRSRETLTSQAREVTSTFGVPCEIEVLVSDDALSSVISTRSKEFDLIIMGTSGPDDLNKFFFGSNTYQVFRKSGIPLLLVPEISRFSMLKRVVYAYDYLHMGVPPLNHLKELISDFNPSFNFLQLTKAPLDEEEEQVIERNSEEISATVGDDSPVTFKHLVSDNYAESIQQYMLTSDANLLVLCTHQYTLTEKLFHKSLSKKISMDFMYPVMIIHE